MYLSKEVTESATGVKIFTFAEAETKFNNETYRIDDLNLKDSKGKIVFTISITTLKRGQQTRGHDHPQWEVYEFVEGKGLMMVDAKAFPVYPGATIFVEPNRFHKVINISTSDDLIFRCYAMGKINRPHLAVQQQS